jgi:hypothetical protein
MSRLPGKPGEVIGSPLPPWPFSFIGGDTMIRTLSRIRSNVLPHPGLRLVLLRLEGRRTLDDLCLTVARHLPARLVFWTTMQAIAHATTGKHGSTVVPELSAMDVLKRWDEDHGIHDPIKGPEVAGDPVAGKWDPVRDALVECRHALTTHQGLWAHDGDDTHTFRLDDSDLLKRVDAILAGD